MPDYTSTGGKWKLQPLKDEVKKQAQEQAAVKVKEIPKLTPVVPKTEPKKAVSKKKEEIILKPVSKVVSERKFQPKTKKKGK